uniref:Acetylcholine-binding protein type 1 n=1 Tax=Biomphalaria glabrata TaxID=6526 RepID=J7JQC3_BIOGL|nr:acetylcholine-binding protein type 1 [Biomphalaria glabrata]
MDSFLVVLILCFLTQGSYGSRRSRSEILQDVLSRCSPLNIPIEDDQPVKVSFEYSLQKIFRADVENDEVDIGLWTTLVWKDRCLNWFNEFTSFKELTVPIAEIWTPDIFIFDSVGAPEIFSDKLARVSQDGTVTYVPQLKVRLSCPLADLKLETGVTCSLKSGSWTHSTQELTLEVNAKVDLGDYASDTRFQLLNATQQVNRKQYPCCPETYEDATLSFTFRKP